MVVEGCKKAAYLKLNGDSHEIACLKKKKKIKPNITVFSSISNNRYLSLNFVKIKSELQIFVLALNLTFSINIDYSFE